MWSVNIDVDGPLLKMESMLKVDWAYYKRFMDISSSAGSVPIEWERGWDVSGGMPSRGRE